MAKNIIIKVLSLILLPVISIVFTTFNSEAQNFVSNGDFEEYLQLPNDAGELNFAVGWSNVNGHYSSSGKYASPDYLNTKGYMNIPEFGTLSPFSGEGQARFATYLVVYKNDSNYREYLSTKLSKSLTKGNLYQISFYLTNGRKIGNDSGITNIGINFSMNSLKQLTTEPIILNPQIDFHIDNYLNYWKKFTFYFIPIDNYEYITIGNFRDDLLTDFIGSNNKGHMSANYFIDKIELYQIKSFLKISGKNDICKGEEDTLFVTGNDKFIGWADSLQPDKIISKDKSIRANPYESKTYIAFGENDTTWFKVNVKSYDVKIGNDTSICIGDSLIINTIFDGSTCIWNDKTTDPVKKITNEGIYKVTVNFNKCSVTDSIKVLLKVCDPEIEMPNVFTPGNDDKNEIFVPIIMNETKNSKLSIYNRWGKLIFKTDFLKDGWNGKYNETYCPEGVYFWILEYTGFNNRTYILKGFVELIR
ncbi:MAG: gliding motility-associated C-terminal domain-containing protein [Bacteroidota bacterium]|nr:gliding motility-associated C-terminal domain-containing protein [Bacteroidota bacterium]